jgi:hypothetical protein
MRDLSMGCAGPDVRLIQKGLNEWMYAPQLRPKLSPRGRQLPRLVEDGRFGPRTHEAVVEFQRANQLRPDGIVGRKTQFMVYPFVQFSATLVGHGRAGGENGIASAGASGAAPGKSAALRGPLLGQMSRPVAGGGSDEPSRAILGKIDLGPGAKLVLPPIPLLPGDPQWQATYTISALLLRLPQFELSAEGEFSRVLPVGEASKWQFTGSLTGQYTPAVTSNKWFDGSVYAKLGKQGSFAGAGLGLEGCWKPLGNDALQLCVSAEQAATLRPDARRPEFEASHEISGGIKGSFEFTPLFQW